MVWVVAVPVALALVATLLPFVPLPHGVFRVGEFPRVQIMVWSLLAAALAFALLPLVGDGAAWGWTLGVLALLCAAVQAWFIRPFTPFARRRVREHDADAFFRREGERAPRVSLFAANVKQSNRDYDRLTSVVLALQPDIAVFMETDQGWADALAPVTADYPFRMEEIHDTGYGMIMVSRVPIEDGRVRHLLNEEVPSFDCVMNHPEGDRFRLIALHPEPPTVQDDTIGRDAEIGQVGLAMRSERLPGIVFGDLNDVAWSSTTRRFLRLSRMLDPRHGRGQYNSFDARYPPMRWPLDHIFVTPHFELVSLRRMPFIGSDHFPMFYELALTDRSAPKVEEDPASRDDVREVVDLIATERGRDRRPIGVDWEEG